LRNLYKLLGLLWISCPVYAAVIEDSNQNQPPLHNVPLATFATQQLQHVELSVLAGGSYIPNTIDGQRLQLLPFETGPNADTFINQSNGAAVTWGLDAKYRFNLRELTHQNFIDSFGVGVDVFQITNFNQTGKVLQFGMPVFENYNYILQLKNTRLMADFDMDFHPLGRAFIPFIEGGIGAASTDISYTSYPILPVQSPNFTLANHSSWNFAYQVGAGIKYAVNNQFILSFRYLYANMGKVDSSTAGDTATLATPLSVNMRTQNLLLGITYLVK
jgi:opacity protein-like surface antigen